MIENQTGSEVSIDYRAPQSADVVMQNEILERSMATKPDGIAVDLLDGEGNRAVIEDALQRKIPVVVFDSEPPSGMSLTSVGGDSLRRQGLLARGWREILNQEGEVAIMQGCRRPRTIGSARRLIAKSLRSIPKMKLVAGRASTTTTLRPRKRKPPPSCRHPNLWMGGLRRGGSHRHRNCHQGGE